jgi:hypothetical protein
MRLFELYDDKENGLNWKWHGDAYYSSFVVDGQEYAVQMRKIEEDSMIYRQFNPAPPVTNNTWYYAFAPMDSNTGQPVNTRFPTNKPIELISTVINIAVKFIQANTVDVLYYGGDETDPVRVRVYGMITKKMTTRYGWEMAGEGDATFMGVRSHFYYIKKP